MRPTRLRRRQPVGFGGQWSEFAHYNFQMASYAEQYAHDAGMPSSGDEVSEKYIGTFALNPTPDRLPLHKALSSLILLPRR